MLTIQPLESSLVPHLKSVRLRALQDTPTAFGRTYNEEQLLSDEEWHKRAATWSNGTTSICFLALENDLPCGLIAAYRDPHDPSIPNVASMWVAPTHRRSGLGTTLLAHIEQWAKNLSVTELRLMVISNNVAAIHFYERLGFTATGATAPYPHDATLHECELRKPL